MKTKSSLGIIYSPITLATPFAPLNGRPWVFSFSNFSASLNRNDITVAGTKTQGIGLAFNNFYPTTAVPEPGELTLVLIGAYGLLIVWRPHSSRIAHY